MDTLKIEHASYSYDKKTPVLVDLNCTITTDDIFCILGPNGIGKSTLLNGIMNLHEFDEGRVLLNGKDVRDYTRMELAKKIAYIPQTYHLVFPYKVLDLILMGRTPHLNKMNQPSELDYQKAMEAVKALHLERFIDRDCTQLSGGELQLVMLARAIAQESSFLLLDEPTSHLDFGHELETLEMLKHIHERGMGVIFTTHNPNHAFLVCDKVAIMSKGTFTQAGSPADIVTAETLSKLYGVDVQIISYGEGTRYRVCAPTKGDVDSW